jgi:hypothetical protein
MAKVYVPAEAFFVAVVKKVVLTEKGPADLVQVTLEIPCEAWVNTTELNPLRGQLAMVRMESIRLEELKTTDLRVGRGPHAVPQ